MITQKDFIALAKQLKAIKPTYTPNDDPEDHGAIRYQMWTECVIAVMNVCIEDNPKFHKGKFMTACGVPNIGLK